LDLLSRFKDFVHQQRLIKKEARYLLACSGGMDSIVLVDLCIQSKIEFDLAHVNYGLRGEDSNLDEKSVWETAKRIGVHCHLTHFPDSHRVGESGYNLQEQARNFRYAWFSSLRDERGNEYAGILTAHHGNDQAETVLKNLFFGTGLSGLAGMSARMKPQSGLSRLRPLLFATKEELQQYAIDRGIKWREDASNESDDYIRNIIRKQLTGNLLQRIPSLINNINKTAFRLDESGRFIQTQVKKWMDKHGVFGEGESRLPIQALQQTEGYIAILECWLKSMGFTYAQLQSVAQLMCASNGRMIESESHRLVRDRGWLVCLEKKSENNSIQFIEEGCLNFNFDMGRLVFQANGPSLKLDQELTVAQMDYSKLEFPLKLRRWKPGDYFYPLGMTKKKKLSRFLIDLKLTPLEKEKVWIMESGSRICWVVGLRIDNRFKVDESSYRVLKINLE
jgi:tRNA(Ile)-lysidine synthase